MTNPLLRNVSRETLSRLQRYHDLLSHESKGLNLISRKNQEVLWERHILDSLIGGYVIEAERDEQKDSAERYKLLDIGSGGGLPGIVLAIYLRYADVTLCESTRKKCLAMGRIAKAMDLPVEIRNDRAETLTDVYDVVTSRAVAPLIKLLPLLHGTLNPGGFCVLWKGRRWEEEMREARSVWRFTLDVRTLDDILRGSQGPDSPDDGRVWLIVRDIQRK